MSARLRPWTTRQEGVVAAWQLREAGWSRKAIACRTAGLRRLQDGVVLTGDAPPTHRQQLWAAALTAPGRWVSHWSSGSAFSFSAFEEPVHVTEIGTGGDRDLGTLVIHRSMSLGGHTGDLRGLPILSPARTLIDLEPELDDDAALGRLVREALRVGALTCAQLQIALLRSPVRKRPRRLTDLAAEYARLRIRDSMSDPEAHALALFSASGRPIPRVNAVVAGRRADLSWPDLGLIIELDSREFHQFPGEDAARTARWTGAGSVVERLPTSTPYDAPGRLFRVFDEHAARVAGAPASPPRTWRSRRTAAGEGGEPGVTAPLVHPHPRTGARMDESRIRMDELRPRARQGPLVPPPLLGSLPCGARGGRRP